jgi:hypothetical protein
MLHEALRIGRRISVLPIIYGSGDFALEVRRVMLDQAFDCLAVPLPPSFQRDVEAAIRGLPTPSLVTQAEPPRFATAWTPGDDDTEEAAEEPGEAGEQDARTLSYVPIDPCQGVIMALRIALGEHMARAFIDLETSRFLPYSAVLPDPYALKKVPLERFCAAILPHLSRVPDGQPQDRVRHMAQRLRALEQRYHSILLVCSLLDWPWIREAYVEEQSPGAEDDAVEDTVTYRADAQTLLFLFGELPFVTGLYERARAELGDDENLSIDGVKELLLAARSSYLAEFKGRARRITPHLLAVCLKYIRNLSLIERRMTPDLYNIVIAAKQVFGDQYAIHAAERARDYPYAAAAPGETIKVGIDRGELPDGEIVSLVSRLPGPPLVWRSLHLQRRPALAEVQRWQLQWNPFSQCSWPPEDELIEDFRTHVFDRARAVLGADLARSEKFTTSVMDGIDVRETLRHWYDGDIYVKVLPPSRGQLDCVVMLFDSPADPRDYPWRTTWYAEHDQESTLAFFATDFRREMVGPGICVGTYGGALFLFPPLAIPDVWTDPRLDFTETLEERLLAAACLHSRSRHIVLLSPLPPGAGWRRLARHFHRRWVHLPLGQFSDSTIQQLRLLHVLNGKEVRSYAAQFIRRA